MSLEATGDLSLRGRNVDVKSDLATSIQAGTDGELKCGTTATLQGGVSATVQGAASVSIKGITSFSP
jgi:hypothetical protein